MACVFTALLVFAKPGAVVIGMGFFVLAEIGYRAAQVYYVVGQTDRALQLLTTSVEGGYPRTEIGADPLFADLSGDPGFDALVDESLP